MLSLAKGEENIELDEEGNHGMGPDKRVDGKIGHILELLLLLYDETKLKRMCDRSEMPLEH